MNKKLLYFCLHAFLKSKPENSIEIKPETMNPKLRLSTGLLLALLFIGCSNYTKINMLPYPQTPREDVVDTYFGTIVPDPYRWLEDPQSERTAQWVAAQNRVTFDFLSQIPYRDAIRDRITQLWNYPKEGLPHKAAEYYFIFRNDGLQNQSVLYRQKGLDAAPEVFLDPNTLSDDGTVALGFVSFSPNDKYMAYGVSSAGSDWVEIRVMETATGRQLSDAVRWVKFSGAEWTADSKGFYYSRYDAPRNGLAYSDKNENQKVYLHRIGTPQSADIHIYQDKFHPLRYFSAEQSSDGKYLFINSSEGTSGSEILYRPTTGDKGTGFRTLLKGFDHDYAIIYSRDDAAYVLTNDAAPNYRLIKIDLRNPQTVTDIIPQNPDCLLESVSRIGDSFIATYLENATNKSYQFSADGTLLREIEFPMLGSVSGFSTDDKNSETFYSLTNYLTPSTIYRYDASSGESQLFWQPELKYDPQEFTTEQIFYNSKDEERIPMFISYRKGIKLDGTNPTLLYGYGGFNISLTPSFSPAEIFFMEQGGIYVEANIRGGGEYGEKWHRAGMLENKQNVFDDFIAAAEYLIEKGYTSSDRLAISGGSNGGLLVGACMTQRPDLFAVALPAVGVLDMLRYHLFTIGWGWSVEYGNSDNQSQFEYIYKYSPLHNIRQGVCYPATLITTSDHDDRVVPAHSFKFAAELQHAQNCETPILIRIETNAGHGAGKPTSKRIEEAADKYAFLFYNTDTTVKIK